MAGCLRHGKGDHRRAAAHRPRLRVGQLEGRGQAAHASVRESRLSPCGGNLPVAVGRLPARGTFHVRTRHGAMASHHRRHERFGPFGLVNTAIVRRDLMDGEESVLAIRDNWEVADFDACEWSDPNAADPYICVVYDLRRLAEDEDGKPHRMKGTMRYDTHYSLSGFDYLTFPAK